MPFDGTHGVVYGDDARKVPQWARGAFCAWLAGKLNDADGPYADGLGITAERQAVVTDNRLVAREQYSAAGSPPVVFVAQGSVEATPSGKRIGGVSYRGTRYEIAMELDMGISDKTPDEDDETAEVRDDSLLASFVSDAVERGRAELDALGLNNGDLKADTEKQRAGEGRYPHRLKCFCLGLNDWAP
jgi:hypothetical protein